MAGFSAPMVGGEGGAAEIGAGFGASLGLLLPRFGAVLVDGGASFRLVGGSLGGELGDRCWYMDDRGGLGSDFGGVVGGWGWRAPRD